MHQLKTKWCSEAEKEHPLGEYPRPQLVRSDWMSLNGEWDFALMHTHSEIPKEYDKKIVVPYCVESYLSKVQEKVLPQDQMWYRKCFSMPESWNNKKIMLHFDAVDYDATVYLNGCLLGSHRGGYLPFEFEISSQIKENNELVVVVKDPTNSSYHQSGKQSLKPRGVFYTATSGIWQSVWLEPVGENHITSLRITPDPDNCAVSITVITGKSCPCEIEVIDKDGNLTAKKAKSNEEVVIHMDDPILWSTENPFLYDLKIRTETDSISSYFGMRKFGYAEKNGHKVLTLNSKEIFHLGVLDQGYWPESLLTPTSEEAMEFDILRLKELGFNTIRKHIKIEPLRWYYLCDKLGMIVWQDMVSGGYKRNALSIYIKSLLNMRIEADDTTQKMYKDCGRDTSDSREEYESELEGMIRHLYNCSSIACWVPFNERWGQFDAKRIAQKVKKLDPTRYVDHASGWIDQKAGDFNSEHQYFRKLSHPKISDSRVFVISECGGFGYSESGHTYSEQALSYAKFKEKELLDERYRSFVEEEIMPLKEQGLSAVIYTQLSDVENEMNGLFTYDREILKFNKIKMKQLNKKVTES